MFGKLLQAVDVYFGSFFRHDEKKMRIQAKMVKKSLSTEQNN